MIDIEKAGGRCQNPEGDPAPAVHKIGEVELMKRNNTVGMVFGFLFIFLGAGYLAKAFGVLPDFTVFFDGWWTMFIIVPCFCGIISKNNEDKLGYLIGVIIGLLLLLMAQDVISSDKIWTLIVAGIFVAVGVSILFPKKNGSSHDFEERQDRFDRTATTYTTATGENGEKIIVDELGNEKRENFNPDGEKIVCSAVFAGRDIRVDNSVFIGADLTGIFGGIDLNLKNAIIQQNVTIDVKTIFGGIDILVPPDVRVVTEVNPILGGVENKAQSPLGADEKTPTIYIRGTCIFGGVEVK